jgi:hypothetical protein
MHKQIFLIVLFASFVKIIPAQVGMAKNYSVAQLEIPDDENTGSEESEKLEKAKAGTEDKLGHHWYHHAVINASRLLTVADSDDDPYLSFFSQPATPPPNYSFFV